MHRAHFRIAFRDFVGGVPLLANARLRSAGPGVVSEWIEFRVDKFSPKTIDALGYYVYLYSDPVTKVPFYVGKGKGNRAFAHLHDGSKSEKTRKIAEIQARGNQPLIEILAFGLDEGTAYKVEAAAIDLLGLKNLTNKQAGHESSLYGRIEVSDLDARFDHGELTERVFFEDAVLVKVNQLYRNGMSDFELYEVTRGFWRVDKSKIEGIHLALAVYDGMVLEPMKLRHGCRRDRVCARHVRSVKPSRLIAWSSWGALPIGVLEIAMSEKAFLGCMRRAVQIPFAM